MRAALVLLALALVAPSLRAAPDDTAWIWSSPSGAASQAVAYDLEDAGLAFHAYPELGMLSFVAPEPVARAIVLAHGGRVDPNERLELHLDKSVPYIGADVVKREVGPARTGPTVLVVDTGVDSAHPDFQGGNLVTNAQASRVGGLVVGSLEQVPVVDLSGHGTHVAGIVAGSGASLGAADTLHNRYRGVYSNGRIAGYQAATAEADPGDIAVDIVAALEAFDWAIANRDEYDIRVVSNSWGDDGAFDPDHPVNQATLRLYLRGMVVVFSAGNHGEDGPGSLNTYCLAPWVFCTAAGDLDGHRASFSGQGREAPDGGPYEHPDITAPGVLIHSARPLPGLVGLGAVTSLVGGIPSRELYVDRSGTSMAAPHVAGTAGLLQAANPFLSPDQVMDVLVATARPMSDPVWKAGAGYLNAEAAYELAVATEGNRAAFLAGDAVKYAGAATGDPDYGRDPVSVGYEGDVPAGLLELPARTGVWLATPPAWLVVGAALVSVAAGTRVRRRARSAVRSAS